jgi:hypothetical protein
MAGRYSAFRDSDISIISPVGVTNFTPSTNDENCAERLIAVSLAWVPLMAPTWKLPYSRTTGGWRPSSFKWALPQSHTSFYGNSQPFPIDGEDASHVLHRDDDAGTYYAFSGRMHSTDDGHLLVLFMGSSDDGLNVLNLRRPLEVVIGYFKPNLVIPVGEKGHVCSLL